MNGVVEFDKYTEPMKRLLEGFLADPHPAYVVSSAHPRMVDGALPRIRAICSAGPIW